MFCIAIISDDDNEVHYWTGGDIFSADPEEAVRFTAEKGAENSIPILKRGLGNGSNLNAQVVPFPDPEDE